MAKKKIEETPVEETIVEVVAEVAEVKDVEVSLEPVEGESDEHKRVREVYIAFKLQSPEKWEEEKEALLAKLAVL